jgi:hypothetical protein
MAGRPPPDVEAALLAAAADANARIASCHEHVACPKCGAPVGEVCRNMNIGRRRRGAPTKHPHQERWTLVQAAR